MTRFVLAAVAGLAGLGVAAACSEPYDGDVPTPAPDRDSAAGEDAAVDGAPAPAPADAALDAADARSDADPCDRDRDGVLVVTCDGGTDCDDDDDRAQPDAGFRTDEPTAKTKGDWNCDGNMTAQRITLVECSAFTSFTVNCSAVEGFKDDPGCGQNGTYVKCKAPAALGACVEDTVVVMKQACK